MGSAVCWVDELSGDFEVETPAAPLRFRIIVQRVHGDISRVGEFRMRLFRAETFRINLMQREQVTGLMSADHEIYIIDPMFDGKIVHADSADQAYILAIKEVEMQLNVAE